MEGKSISFPLKAKKSYLCPSQLKVTNSSCPVPADFQRAIKVCYGPWSNNSVDTETIVPSFRNFTSETAWVGLPMVLPCQWPGKNRILTAFQIWWNTIFCYRWRDCQWHIVTVLLLLHALGIVELPYIVARSVAKFKRRTISSVLGHLGPKTDNPKTLRPNGHLGPETLRPKTLRPWDI